MDNTATTSKRRRFLLVMLVVLIPTAGKERRLRSVAEAFFPTQDTEVVNLDNLTIAAPADETSCLR